MPRRNFLKTGIGALSVPLLAGCGVGSVEPIERASPRLTARPGLPSLTIAPGLNELGLRNQRDGMLYVPESYTPDVAMPLFVGLHGASGRGEDWASYYARAEERGMVFLAPDSRGVTWDLMTGASGGIDVAFIDEALAHVFDRVRIDPDRIALGGFSDGASYCLSIGLSNGDLFSNLAAYSPGFFTPLEPLVGRPKIYVSHGTQDGVLSVTYTRGTIVPVLQGAGYDVIYEEFSGGHSVPAAITEQALDWFLADEAPTV
jgi:predicted esterase